MPHKKITRDEDLQYLARSRLALSRIARQMASRTVLSEANKRGTMIMFNRNRIWHCYRWDNTIIHPHSLIICKCMRWSRRKGG